ITGFQHPDDVEGLIPHESFEREALERFMADFKHTPGYRLFFARRNGAVAGCASMRLCNGVAQLCGAATLPEHRRRGVQSALLRARLADAAIQGCDIAVMTTQPGSKSQQNAIRQGFSILYTRAILRRG
ncbi:MAG: GNAT family N-acetyltransferase, partial [Gammaproteobacteria bacterium]